MTRIRGISNRGKMTGEDWGNLNQLTLVMKFELFEQNIGICLRCSCSEFWNLLSSSLPPISVQSSHKEGIRNNTWLLSCVTEPYSFNIADKVCVIRTKVSNLFNFSCSEFFKICCFSIIYQRHSCINAIPIISNTVTYFYRFKKCVRYWPISVRSIWLSIDQFQREVEVN